MLVPRPTRSDPQPQPRPSPTVAAFFAALLLLVLVTAPASAPAAPLFRHALSQWAPADYPLILFHEGPLTPEQETWFNDLKPTADLRAANLAVSLVDLTDLGDDTLRVLWNSQSNATPPWLVLRTPVHPTNHTEPPTLWTSALKQDSAQTLLNSPARRQIAEALLRGDTIVWVLIESGEAALDENVVDELASALKHVELAASRPSSPTNPKAAPTPVSFSLIRVTRHDPAEEVFLASLLHGRVLPANRPAAFPVYGRGRTLPPLVGRHLSDKAIEQTCRLLMGPCGPDAAKPPPGHDLLISVAWRIPATNVPPAGSNPGGTSAPHLAAVRKPAADTAEEDPGRPDSGWKETVAIAMVATVSLGLVLLVRSRRRQ